MTLAMLVSRIGPCPNKSINVIQNDSMKDIEDRINQQRARKFLERLKKYHNSNNRLGLTTESLLNKNIKHRNW